MSTPTSLKKPASKGEHRGPHVSAMFDRIAGTYDLLNDCISLGMHRGWKKTAVKALQLQPGHRVLDVCTGTGDLVQYIQPVVGPSGQVVGIDFSPEMLAVAKQRFAEQRFAEQRFAEQSAEQSHVEFVLGSALELPFDANSFDGAVISFGLRNVDNINQAIAEMARVVKPGGWVVNVDTSPKPWLPGFWWYFSRIMPVVGAMFSSDRAAYTYLFESTRDFLTPNQLREVFQANGLQQVRVQSLAFGSVSCQAGKVG